MLYGVPDMNGKHSILQKWTPGKYHIFRKLKLKITIIIVFITFLFKHKIIWIFSQFTNENEVFMIIKINKIAEKTTNFLHFEEKNVLENYLRFVLIF